MNLKQRIEGFVQIGAFLERHFSGETLNSQISLHEGLNKLIETNYTFNNWFTEENTRKSLKNLTFLLKRDELESFCAPLRGIQEKTVAIICAGNIPLVCFHDILCVLLSGHRVLIKMSSDDKILLPFLLKLLCYYEPKFEDKILFSEGKLSNFDAIIATGSNNTSNYLSYYFSKYPHIIRKSRTSLAVIEGDETENELRALGHDIFDYFGMGCRNVTKLLVPIGYSFNPFFESIVEFGSVINNKKYGNNYDYYRSIFLLEKVNFLDNNFLILKESFDLFSPVSVLLFQSFESKNQLNQYIVDHQQEIQCIVGKKHVPFGYSQRPVITDFADNINTLDFLLTL